MEVNADIVGVIPAGGSPFVLHASDVLPADRLDALAEVVVEVLARQAPVGRQKSSHATVAELAELFLLYDRDGIPRPTRGIAKVHWLDGRLVEILHKHELGGFKFESEDVPVQTLISRRQLKSIPGRMDKLIRKGRKPFDRTMAKAESTVFKPYKGMDLRRYFEHASAVADRWRELGAG